MPGTLTQTRSTAHGQCRLCGDHPAGIPPLSLMVCGADTVASEITFDGANEGYDGLVHGGIAAAICDAAMCNALFAQGLVGFTAKLELRYPRPLRLDAPARVVAHYEGCRGGAWHTRAYIEQDGTAVEAKALFMPVRATGTASQQSPKTRS